ILKALTSNWGWLMLLAGTLATTAIYVEASRRILYWDNLNYWSKTEALADLIRGGQWWQFLHAVVDSIGNDYSLIPAVLPSVLIAPLPSKFLLGYKFSVAAVYLVPALLAVGVLGLTLARAVSPSMGVLTWRERIELATLGAVAAVLLLPHFLQVFLNF